MSQEASRWTTVPADKADRVAIRTHQAFVSGRAPVLLESAALRRPEIVVRRTRYVGVVVDERLLTRAFPPSKAKGRLQAFMMMRGSLHYGGSSALGAGCTVLLRPEHQACFRFDNAEFLEIEWTTDEDVSAPTPLESKVDPSALFASFDEPALGQRELYSRAIATFRRAGAPLGAHRAEAFRGAPSEREERIAQAIMAQLRTIGTTADTLALGEAAGVSPRHLQRVYARLCATYGMTLASWRDTRNRWRVQVAAVLLSRPDMSLADIAAETGYRSTQAMARSFLHAGLPSPSAVRRLARDPGSISDMAAHSAGAQRTTR